MESKSRWAFRITLMAPAIEGTCGVAAMPVRLKGHQLAKAAGGGAIPVVTEPSEDYQSRLCGKERGLLGEEGCSIAGRGKKNDSTLECSCDGE